MQIRIKDPGAIGRIARGVRKRQRVRQDDLAAVIGASHVFVRHVEHGKLTVQLGKVFQLLDELGIRVILEVPDDFAAAFADEVAAPPSA